MNKPNLPSYRSECGLRLRASRRSLLMGAAAVVAAIALSSPASPVPSQASSPTMLAFQTMIGDVGPYVGPANPIRDIPGAGAPWFISSATGRLTTSGQLFVAVRGLVLSNGTNPVPDFRAVVSCRAISAGHATLVNLITRNFPATPSGDSTIVATVKLPHPCFAPVILVTSPSPGAPSWFAVTGAP